MVTAVIMGMLALTSEPWWTLRGENSDRILNIAVSPFYVQIQGNGLPSSIPLGSALGPIARILLLSAALLLGWSALRPEVWWRNLAAWFATSSLMVVFLSLALMLHAVRTLMLTLFGDFPPFYGTANLPGPILGLDLVYYQSPPVIAAFTASFSLALVGLAIICSTQLPELLKIPERLLASVFGRPTISVSIKPPSPVHSLSSAEEILNMLRGSLETLTEDELALSFRKLSRALQPGSRVSLRVPASAAPLIDRLFRLIPRAGLHLESMQVVSPTPGKVENELLFQKPVTEMEPVEEDQPSAKTEASDEAKSEISPEEVKPESVTKTGPAPEDELGLETEEFVEEESVPEPVAALEVEQPASSEQMSPESTTEAYLENIAHALSGDDFQEIARSETSILDSALAIITRFGQPVPYSTLVNEVYVDLLNKTPELTSHRQIEKVLVKHVGRELTIIEDPNRAFSGDRRKWWLAEGSRRFHGPHGPSNKYSRGH